MERKTQLWCKMQFYNEYYENPNFWGNIISSPHEKERLEKTISLIPNDVVSILDVGCGDGTFVNNLSNDYRILAVDQSASALKHVKRLKIFASIENLPFDSGSFDLVVCAEVLEHLPYGVYERGIQELERVSSKYIIISVPNRENIVADFLKCPICNCQFNLSRHVRSFNYKKIVTLFNNFKMSEYLECGPITRRDTKFLSDIKHLFNLYLSSATALCPQCGFNGKFESNNNIIVFFYKVLNKFLLHHKAKRWIIARFEKNIFEKC